jgi:hypothetical protein
VPKRDDEVRPTCFLNDPQKLPKFLPIPLRAFIISSSSASIVGLAGVDDVAVEGGLTVVSDSAGLSERCNGSAGMSYMPPTKSMAARNSKGMSGDEMMGGNT